MAKTKTIQKFLNKQLYEMRNTLNAFCTADDTSQLLHSLRLNAKKTKAVVSMINDTSGTKKLSIKKLKGLFDHAGEIRTAQLNIKALNENNIANEELEKEQNIIIETSSAELCICKKTY